MAGHAKQQGGDLQTESMMLVTYIPIGQYEVTMTGESGAIDFLPSAKVRSTVQFEKSGFNMPLGKDSQLTRIVVVVAFKIVAEAENATLLALKGLKSQELLVMVLAVKRGKKNSNDDPGCQSKTTAAPVKST
jgi:hypothetical protein